MNAMSKKRSNKNQQTNQRLLWVMGLATIIILAAAVVLLSGGNDENTAVASEISVEEAVTLRDDGAFILDVRQPEEWDDFHIPGSTLIPLGELPSRLSEVPEDQEIVVVCRSGNRSQSGRDILTDAGFTQVTSMRGGVSEWRDMGFPIE